MRPWTTVLVTAVGALIACGGRIGDNAPDAGKVYRGEAGSAEESGSPEDGAPGVDSGSSSGPSGNSDAAVITCTLTRNSGGGSGGDTCDVSSVEVCSDGNIYGFDCGCPSATCTCSVGGSGSGGSGFTTDYAGCPSCEPVAWSVCGFPAP